MNTAENTPSVALVVFGDGQVSSALSDLPAHRPDGPAEIDSVIGDYGRLVVIGADADLAGVLSRASSRAARPAWLCPAGNPDSRRDRVGDRRPGSLAATG